MEDKKKEAKKLLQNALTHLHNINPNLFEEILEFSSAANLVEKIMSKFLVLMHANTPNEIKWIDVKNFFKNFPFEKLKEFNVRDLQANQVEMLRNFAHNEESDVEKAQKTGLLIGELVIVMKDLGNMFSLIKGNEKEFFEEFFG